MIFRRLFLNIKHNLFNLSTTFWSGVFPFLLGTLFFLAFGRFYIDTDTDPIPVAVVAKDTGTDNYLLTTLKAIADEKEPLLAYDILTEKEASAKLKDGTVSGIIYADGTPTLAVTGQGVDQTTLKTILDTYIRKEAFFTRQIKSGNAAAVSASASKLLSGVSTGTLTGDTNLSAKEISPMMQYFYALVAMACMYFSFYGLRVASGIQANLTPLAARRSVSGQRKSAAVLENYASAFLISFVIFLLLIVYLRVVAHVDFGVHTGLVLLTGALGTMFGLALGIFIGSISRLLLDIKVGLCIGISMLLCFMAGLMMSNIPKILEQRAPILNRLNPATLLSECLYCLTYFDDFSRYTRNMLILAAMTAVLTLVSIFKIRRMKYASI